MSVLEADDDYHAIGARLERHEAAEMQRAYRREAERLLLWAIVERSKALSSLTREDATAYRAFLRHPSSRAGSHTHDRGRRRNGGPLPARYPGIPLPTHCRSSARC